MGVPEGFLPDRSGDRAAVDLTVAAAAERDVAQWVLLRSTRVTDEHGTGHLRGVSGEPGGGGAVGTAGLARGRTADTQTIGGAALEGVRQQVGDTVGHVLVDDTLTLGFDVDGRAGLAIVDAADGLWFAVDTAGGERGVGACHRDR